MKQDRFLLVILGFIGLLMIVSVGLFFKRQAPQAYRSEATPEGVIWNYVLAIQNGDYERAFTYLQTADGRPDFNTFQRSLLINASKIAKTAVQTGDAVIRGDTAHLTITIIHTQSGLFDPGWTETGTALLVWQDGQWRIAWMPYPYWGWEWYPPK